MRDERASPDILALVRDASHGVIIQGITGSAARRHVDHMRRYGTNVVAGVVPGKGGSSVEGIPVFDTVRDARTETGATVCTAFVPPSAAADGLMEAAQAGIKLSVCLSEGLSTHDSAMALEVARTTGMVVLGPNTAGVAIPGRLLLGFLPVSFAMPGTVAVISRSGTLSYELVWAMSRAGIGQALWMGVGGDPMKGVAFADVIPTLSCEQGVRGLVLIGEIGGTDEERAAEVLSTVDLPSVALVAGRHAPEGVPMGHAGALVDGHEGGWRSKFESLTAARVAVASSPRDAVQKLRDVLRT